jgi:hypothetical protein
MQVVFISGPYRAATIRGIQENIRRAEEWMIKFILAGWAVICPHKNTALFDGLAPDETWLKMDRELLSRCDAVFMMPGWEKSEGAKAERQEARRLGLRIIYDSPDLPATRE